MSSASKPELMVMPLHAVTARLGERGLRGRFAAEIAGFAPADRERLNNALALAAVVHAQDRRTTEPYLNHLLRVAIRIVTYYDVRDVDVLCAALLHDSVEDHPAEVAAYGQRRIDSELTLDGLIKAALDALADQFGPRVAELVAAVTNPRYTSDGDTNLQYREHLAHRLDLNPWARIIKISDFTDNGVGIIYTEGPKLLKGAIKYRPVVPILRELIARPDTPLAPEVKAHIFDQLDLAEKRFAAILDKG
jgi:HD domain-containing protein